MISRTRARWASEAERQTGQTGVWRDGRKLASIGVHARDWVTWHGVALNIENDLSTFDFVVPCGLDGVTMTTVKRECATSGVPYPGFTKVSQTLVAGFAETFGFGIHRWTPDYGEVQLDAG